MSQTRTVETIGADIDQAIDAGLKILDVSRESVYVEIIEEPSRGLLGIGARQARVRLTTTMPPRSEQAAKELSARLSGDEEEHGDVPETEATPESELEAEEASVITGDAEEDTSELEAEEAPVDPVQAEAESIRSAIEGVDEKTLDEEVQVGVEVLHELLSHMNVEAELTVERVQEDDSEDNPWILHIQGDNLGFLIGRRGETLAALQYLTRMIASRSLQQRASFVIDVENYKARREVLLRKLAQRMAKDAIKRRRRIELEPMPPHERRIIHMELRDNPAVKTESTGEGDRRRVTITPVKR